MTPSKALPNSSLPAPGTFSVTSAGLPVVDQPHGAQVLSTLNEDGSRRWLKPKPSPGRFLSMRRVVAYLLIAIFATLPLIQIHGHPFVLLDITSRTFHIFGGTFLPTDTLLLALLIVIVFLTIFWMTALLGRIWCGWACPQTVYMEFLFRPIERLFERTQRPSSLFSFLPPAAAKTLKLLVYLVCAFVLAHLFLAYFVPWSSLRHWVFGSPIDHPIGFLVVVAVTGAMMFDFGYFREQVCILVCPYGRFQSVMLDRHSMVVRYDTSRGEPRGRKASSTIALPVLSDQSTTTQGDCIDCLKCVTTCPTGIDIRGGLQMECIGCAQCIDACDDVMHKIGRAPGLIRYSSQAAMEGRRFSLLRPRVILYPAIIAALATLFTYVLLGTGIADVTVLRGLGQPFTQLADGTVRNTARIRITNRTDDIINFALSISGADHARIAAEDGLTLAQPGQTITVPVEIEVPSSAFHAGRASVNVLVSDRRTFTVQKPFTMLGPSSDVEHKGTP